MSAEGSALLLATKDIEFDVAHCIETSTSQSGGKGWDLAPKPAWAAASPTPTAALGRTPP